MAETRRIHGGDLAIAYRTWGDTDAPPVILLHGLTSSGAAWEPVAAKLSRRWRLYAPDARGHGDSDRAGEYSFASMREDLAHFREALDLRHPAVIGHSMGGIAAYRYAATRPAGLAGLVLSETPPPTPVRRPLPPRPTEPLSYDFDARVAVIGQLASPDPRWWEELAAIRVPSLVIGGGTDSPFDQEHMAAMADRIPNGSWLSIPGGHGLPATRPDELATAVAGALDTFAFDY